MVRKRLSLQFIEDDRRRKATYTKRTMGIKKKAMELAKLCDIVVILICFGPAGASSDQIETWPENQSDILRIIEQFRKLSPEDRDRRKQDLKAYIKTQTKKMSVESDRLRKANASGYQFLRHGLAVPEGLAPWEVTRLLDSRLAAVNARINGLLIGQGSFKVENDGNFNACVDDHQLNLWFDDMGGNVGLDEILNQKAMVRFDSGNVGFSNQIYQNQVLEDVTPLDQMKQGLDDNSNLGCNSMFRPVGLVYGDHNGWNQSGIDQIMIGGATVPRYRDYDNNNTINWSSNGRFNNSNSIGGYNLTFPWQYPSASAIAGQSSVNTPEEPFFFARMQNQM